MIKNVRGTPRTRQARVARNQQAEPGGIEAGEIGHDVDAAETIKIAGLMDRPWR